MIEIHIGKDRLDHAGHETLVGRRIIESLREAGVPALGEFALRGVAKGSLLYESEVDLEGDVHKLTWREDQNDRERGKPLRSNLKNGSVVLKFGRHAVAPDDDEL